MRITKINKIPVKKGLSCFADEHNLELLLIYEEDGVYAQLKGVPDHQGFSATNCENVAIDDYCRLISNKSLICIIPGAGREIRISCPEVYNDVEL